MAFTHIQSASSQSPGPVLPSQDVVVSATGSGNLLVVVVAGGGGASVPAFTVSDGSNTFVSATNSRITDSLTNNMALEIFYVKNSVAGVTTITVTPDVNCNIGIAVSEFSGGNTSAPFEVAAAAKGLGVSADSGAIAATTGTLIISGETDSAVFSLSSETLTKGSGYLDGSNLGSNGSNKISVGIEYKIGTFTNPHGLWSLSGGTSWFCNVASFIAASGGGATPPVPMPAVVRDDNRAAAGRVVQAMTSCPDPPPAKPTASVIGKQWREPTFAGAAIALQTAPTAGPMATPANTLALIIREKPQPPRFSGRVLTMLPRFETARRQAQTRVDSPPPLPTSSGKAIAFGAKQPTAPAMGRERIRVVYDPAPPPAPGRVVAFAYPALPTVRLPTGQRLVIRDIDPPPFPGRVVARAIPTREQLPAVPVRAAPLLSAPAPGRVVLLSTAAPPRPRAPFAAVIRDTSPQLPGRIAAFRTIDTAAPAGALVPRAIIIRELAPTPPFVGRVRVAAHAPHDFTLPILTPIFHSASPPEYTSRAADHYNSSEARTFVARRVP